jgi:hypothetical protein
VRGCACFHVVCVLCGTGHHCFRGPIVIDTSCVTVQSHAHGPQEVRAYMCGANNRINGFPRAPEPSRALLFSHTQPTE